VLFLHGLTDTSRSFLPAMQLLTRERPELRLIALDLRGHGGTSLPADPACRAEPERCFGIPALAADALALLDHLALERAHVVGHSLGSFVAQEIALARPERVARMVLIGTTARAAENAVIRDFLRVGLVEGPWKAALEARGLRFPDGAWSLTPLDVEPGVERWLAENWVVEPGADPALLADILPETARTPLGTWIGALRGLERHDNRARLDDLRAPTLVLAPVQDVFFPEEPDQVELRALLATATARHGTRWAWKRYGKTPFAAPGAPQTDLGHNLQWAAPAQVARDIAAFLRADGAPTRELAFLVTGDPPRVDVAPGEALVLTGGTKP
jgi:pimeloyl-ACP methyl ester carboxylesterase